MNQIFVFIILVLTISCSNLKSQNDFEKFTNDFNQVSFPYILYDSIEFENWRSDKFIDTNYVLKYNLILQLDTNYYSLNNVKDYKCSYVGKYKLGNIVVLLYKTYTTSAGDGNPRIILATFTNEGKKVDEIIALWSEAEDHLYSKRLILNISDKSRVEIKSIEKSSEIIKDELRLKAVKENKLNFKIDENGKILRVNN